MRWEQIPNLSFEVARSGNEIPFSPRRGGLADFFCHILAPFFSGGRVTNCPARQTCLVLASCLPRACPLQGGNWQLGYEPRTSFIYVPITTWFKYTMKLKIPKEVQKIFKTFLQAGCEIYLVGGAVRDLLMGRPIHDCDFTTNAPPNKILQLFPQGFYDNIFGTVGVPVQKAIFEITTFRSEKGYSDRRHPDQIVWGKTLEEDLKRRDFTINAIALSPKGEVIDLFGGQEDLQRKTIRCVGNPNKRFQEDALRLLRAVRIATQLGFIIETNTFLAIKKNASLIKAVSGERIREELFKILKSNHPADGFRLLFNGGLLEQILPELTRGYGMAQAKHHKYDVFKHSLESLHHCPSKDPVVRFATLIHDIGKPVTAQGFGENRTFYNHEVVGASIARNIAQRLAFSRKDREKLVTLVRWHQFTVDEHQTDKAIRRFIRRVGKENLKDMIDLRIGDRLGGGCVNATSWRLRRFMKRLVEVQKQPFSVTDLKVNGHDVMKILGIGPGPKVGKVLQALFEEVEDDQKKNKRTYLLKRIKDLARAEGRATASLFKSASYTLPDHKQGRSDEGRGVGAGDGTNQKGGDEPLYCFSAQKQKSQKNKDNGKGVVN